MAYAGKFTSCKVVIARIARTFRPVGSSWINEAIEDLGWAIPAIGYHGGFEEMQTPPPYLKVAHNRVLIPCNVERIKAVEQLLPKDNSKNILNPDGSTPTPIETDSCDFAGVRMRLGSDLTGLGIAKDNPRTTDISSASPYYNINSDYIITSFTDGLIKLHFIGYALDQDSYPRIIDDPDYKMALEWYLVQSMMLKGYKHSEVSFKEAFAMWEMYRLRAENAIKGQTLDSAERFRSTWCRFALGNEYYNDFDMHLEQPNYIS